jgi:AcrR family transcriptional regulator
MESKIQRRDEILDRVVDDLLANGVAELSLRPLAERVGTSARLLIYHFESKERLLDCALTRVRTRVRDALAALATRRRPATLFDALTMFWAWATAAENQGFFRLLFEVDGLSMFNTLHLTQGTRRDGTSVWLAMIARAGLLQADSQTIGPARGTLIMAALNGLLQDFLTTGDLDRTTAALDDLLDQILGGASVTPPAQQKV